MNDTISMKIYPYKFMKIYSVSFKSLSDMHMYISEDPEVNKRIFLRQHSIMGGAEFAGEPFEKAVEYLLGGYEGNYDIALKLQKELEKTVPIKERSRKIEKAMAGSHPNVPAFIAGVPKSMYRLQRAEEKKFVSVWFNLAYPVTTSEGAIINRGALTLSLIKLLEANGLGVDLRVFISSYCRSEIFVSEVRLKAPNERINGRKCFYPMCSRLFLRRIIFRIMESMPFEEPDWYPNYGEPLSNEQFRTIFSIPEKDIVISSPMEMGVIGENINYDSRHFFGMAGLEKYVELQKFGR